MSNRFSLRARVGVSDHVRCLRVIQHVPIALRGDALMALRYVYGHGRATSSAELAAWVQQLVNREVRRLPGLERAA